MNYERLSALFDDELPEKEKEIAIDELLDDEQAQMFWQRMLLMRKAIRNELSDKKDILSTIRKELRTINPTRDLKNTDT